MPPELATLDTAADSLAFERLNRQWQRAFPAGTRREEVWTQIFAPLAEHTSHVYVVDGYFAADLLRGMERPHIKAGGGWFLARLAGTSVGRIHIACSTRPFREKGLDAREVHAQIASSFSRFNTGMSLDLRMVDRRFSHGRRVSFDGWAGFELHRGLASFDGDKLAEIVSLTASLELATEVRNAHRNLVQGRLDAERRHMRPSRPGYRRDTQAGGTRT
jgi:hypothetical protein